MGGRLTPNINNQYEVAHAFDRRFESLHPPLRGLGNLLRLMLGRAEDIKPENCAALFRLSLKEIQNGIHSVSKLVLPSVAQEPVGARDAGARARILQHLVAQAAVAACSEGLDDKI